MNKSNKAVYDLIGIGFGPSNLSLAVALKEANYTGAYLFLEKKSNFSWHPGMMIPDVTIQTPFLKDLVTLHNPQSDFSFLNFLKEQNRLLEFTSLRNFFPTRQEFNAYFQWAARRLAAHVAYNRDVIEINPYTRCGKDIDFVEVAVTNQKTKTTEVYLAKNIVIGTGVPADIPKIDINLNQSVFHAQNFIDNVCQLNVNNPYSFTVIGAGQSAAEITHYLLTNFERARVSILSRGFIFHSLNDNPIVNSLYSHVSSEKFYTLSENARDLLMRNLSLSNFSAVDNDLVRKIAYLSYSRQLQQYSPLKTYPFCELRNIKSKESKYQIFYRDKLHGKIDSFSSDIICFATGYRNVGGMPLLTNMKEYLTLKKGDYDVDSYYRICAKSNFNVGIYLQGYSQKTHGFTEGTIADLAGRARTILQHIESKNTEVTYG